VWPSRQWAVLVFIITVAAVGGIVAWTLQRDTGAEEIEIIDDPPVGSIAGEVYIGGAVGCPGYYQVQANDDIFSLIQAAGGLSATDSSAIELRVVCGTDDEGSQRVNINRAAAWLLQALPGICEERAQAIVTYRETVGRFNNVYDLLEVDDIGPATLEEIIPLITVAD